MDAVHRGERTPKGWLARVRLLAVALLVLALAAACGTDEGTTGAEDDEPEASPSPAAADDQDDAGEETDDAGDETEDAGEDEEEADGVADFYEGETVTIVVATTPGGGFAEYAQIIARYFGEYIPGNPDVVVEFMPGAGHLLATNWVYSAAPRDGTVIGNATGGVVMQQVLDAPGVEFDMREMNFIGTPDPPSNTVLAIRSDAGIDDLEDILEPDGPELVVGVQEPGSLQTDPVLLLRDVLDANINVVTGYPGTAELALAMEQGETQGMIGTWSNFRVLFEEQLASGEWEVLTQFSEEPLDGLEDVPLALDYARNEQERQLVYTGATSRVYIREYFMPPEVPEERVEAIRQAWQELMQDERLHEWAEEAEREIGGVDGATLQESVEQALALDEDLVERLREIFVVE